MDSKLIGIVIGIIAIVAIIVLAYSFMAAPNESPETTEETQPNIEETESENHESYINEEGRKIIVIETGDSLSIGE